MKNLFVTGLLLFSSPGFAETSPAPSEIQVPEFTAGAGSKLSLSAEHVRDSAPASLLWDWSEAGASITFG